MSDLKANAPRPVIFSWSSAQLSEHVAVWYPEWEIFRQSEARAAWDCLATLLAKQLMVPLVILEPWQGDAEQVTQFSQQLAEAYPQICQIYVGDFLGEDYQHLFGILPQDWQTPQLDLMVKGALRSQNQVDDYAQLLQKSEQTQLAYTALKLDTRYQEHIEQEYYQNLDLRQAIFNESTDALFIVDPVTLLTKDCNRRAVELFEADHKTALIHIEGHRLQRFQFTEQEVEQIAEQIKSQGFWSRELEYITLKGKSFWGNIAAKKIVVAGQSLNLVRVTDITQRKQAEMALLQFNQDLEQLVQERNQALIQSEQDLTTIFNNVFDSIVIHDFDGRVLGFNQPALAMFGGTSEQLLAATPPTLSAPGLPLELIAPNFVKASLGETIQLDWEIQRFDDHSILDVEIILRRVILGNRPVCLASLRDISARKRAELALQEAQAFSQSIADSNPALLYIYDLVNQCNLYCNRAIIDSLGYTSEQVQAMGAQFLSGLLHPNDIEAVDKHQQEIAQALDGQELEIEYRIRHASGHWEWLVSHDSIFKRNSTGQVIQYIGAAQNITERKRLEQELRQINLELEQRVEERTQDLRQAIAELELVQAQVIAKEKLAALGTLMAGIAHELRNPLNFVNNYAEVSVELVDELATELVSLSPEPVSEVTTLLTDLRDNATIIHQHGMRAERIIHSMLQHAHLPGETPQLQSLHALLDEALEMTVQCHKLRNTNVLVKIQKHYISGQPMLKCFAAELNRAFLNLFANAFTALEAKQNQEIAGFIPTLTIQTDCKDNNLYVWVHDNGTGIAPEHRHKVFEPFFTTQPAGKGAGLGLSMTHEIIVRQHQGRLGLESELGEFTEFVLTFPMRLD